MADRVVKVSLQAQVSNYLANMEAARKGTEKVTQTLEQQKAASIAAAKAQGEAAAEVGRGMVAVGALAAVAVGLAVKKFADFDEAMSNVKAATQESAENMGLLRDAALDAGARTVFSATEAANAIEELGKAGLSTADILNGGLDGALDLAAAGQLGVAEAAGYAATLMKTFNKDGKDMSHIADLMAAGAGKAMGDVSDLAMAMSQAGLVANSTGLSIEETTGALAAFASKGLLGSDAGTAFKAMLQRLTPQSAEAQKAMDDLGISAYDAGGNFIGMEAFAGNLQDGLKNLTTQQRQAALTTIFGSDAVRAATVLYTEGSKGIGKWNAEVNDSGYAAKVAADRLDNLKGDVEQLGGAFDTYLIKSGSGANDTLRLLTQIATGLITAVGDLPGPVLNGGLALGALVAVVGLVGGGALVAIPKVAAFKVALSTLGVSGGTAARGIGLASGALAVAGIAFALWAGRQAEAAANTAEFKDSLDKTTGATTRYTRELVAKKLAEGVAFDAAKEAGISQKELTDAVIEGGDALDAVNKKLAANNNIGTFFSGVGIRAGNASIELDNMSGELKKSAEQLENEEAAAKDSASSTGDAAGAYQDAADKAGELQGNLSKLIDTINEANGVGQDAISQNASYQSALADSKAAVEEYIAANSVSAEALNESTVAGSENAAMLADLAGKSQDAAKAALDAGGTAEDYFAALNAGRKSIYDTALALTGNADAAQKLTDKIYAMPSAKEIAMTVNTAAANASLDNWIRNVNGRKVEIVPVVGGRPINVGMYADGGAIRGPGGPRSDVIPALLSNGEHVLDAQDVQRMGGQQGVYRFRESLYRGYADGGAIGYVQPTYVQSPPRYALGGSGGSSGITNHWTLNEISDPVGTAQAIQRRQNMIGAV